MKTNTLYSSRLSRELAFYFTFCLQVNKNTRITENLWLTFWRCTKLPLKEHLKTIFPLVYMYYVATPRGTSIRQTSVLKFLYRLYSSSFPRSVELNGQLSTFSSTSLFLRLSIGKFIVKLRLIIELTENLTNFCRTTVENKRTSRRKQMEFDH